MDDACRGNGEASPAFLGLRGACLALTATALTALAGKLLDVRLLASGIPASVPMAPSTAGAFIFLAAALYPDRASGRFPRARMGLLLPVFLLAFPSIAVFLTRYFKGGWGAIAAAHHFEAWDNLWAMSPLTSVLFFLAGAAAAVIISRGGRRACQAAAWGAALAAALATFILIGYFHHAPLFYGGAIIPVAATTAACFLVLSVALLAEAGRGFWPWNLLQGGSPRAFMLRSFLPLSAGAIFLMSVVDNLARLSPTPIDDVVVLIGGLTCTAWLVAKVSRSVEFSIETAERRLGASEEKTHRILQTAMDGYWMLDVQGRVIEVNEAFCRMSGYSREELLSMNIGDFNAVDAPGETAARIRCIIERGELRFETRHRRKDGSVFPVDVGVQYNPVDGGRLIAFVRDITERKVQEAATAANVDRLRLLLDSTAEGIYGVDLKGNCILVNRSCLKTLGYDQAEELLGRFMHEVMHHSRADGTPLPSQSCRVYLAFRAAHPIHVAEDVFWRKDRTSVPVELWSYPILEEDKVIGAVATFIDITERKRAAESLAKSEAQLRQSQKMESVGRLAGGVAHDFNNMLTAINGYAGFAMEGLPEGDQRRVDLKEVLAAGERAARLTKQLLAFSRKQILNPEVLDVNAAVGAIVNMLKRLIGEDIKLETWLAAQPCPVKVDAGQIEQVFLNLAVNARDAMPQGGTLIFETRSVSADADFYLRHPAMPRGPLVCLSVHDTGCGMTDEVKTHLFEPFFTTKEKGKGTGLGLSTVYGVIKQSGGAIEVESAPGSGTIFRIYLPRIGSLPRKRDKDDTGIVLRGNETVLLVEDEDMLRHLETRVLTANGYAVLSAADGKEALKVLSRHGKPVDILVTDVVMPGMSGRELAREVAKNNLAHRTLFVSGYTDDAIVRHGVLESGLAFLYKPFTPDALARKLREVLDGPADKAKA